tara:strand:- start:1817 stop:2044 length:228 start_codon:yes stop_codon:yes gene_type:complete
MKKIILIFICTISLQSFNATGKNLSKKVTDEHKDCFSLAIMAVELAEEKYGAISDGAAMNIMHAAEHICMMNNQH